MSEIEIKQMQKKKSTQVFLCSPVSVLIEKTKEDGELVVVRDGKGRAHQGP